MSLTVATFNIEEALAEADHMPQAIELIKRADADVIVLGDAYSLINDLHGSDKETLQSGRAEIAKLGYLSFEVAYEDSQSWHHDRNLIMLGRVAMSTRSIRLDTRNAIEAIVGSAASGILRVVGVHWDDRAEVTRVRQARSFINQYAGLEAVLLGDLNTLDPRDKFTRWLRNPWLGASVAWLPNGRLGSRARRVHEIAFGQAYLRLEREGYQDVDKRRQPTFPAVHPFLRPDHIMVSNGVVVEDFQVIDGVKGIDHKGLKARLNW